tara:strand:- start:548 stop:769 length:222 start_codon:yes stop_codon:yes gene_type:complete
MAPEWKDKIFTTRKDASDYIWGMKVWGEPHAWDMEIVKFHDKKGTYIVDEPRWNTDSLTFKTGAWVYKIQRRE